MKSKKVVFKRKIYDKMLQWKRERDGSTALLIKGARRVGKSTIAEEFAKNEYESYIVVDFGDAPSSLWAAVENISDRDNFFFQLQFIYGVTLHERRSVVIFDEIQKCPAVRQAIKYLVKDHRYDYIETGSLLSIRKNTKDIVIPSEETRVTMYPMDYEEFRWALGDNTSIPMLKTAFEGKKSLGDALARKLHHDFRLYMIVGGMPQAVETYLSTNNLASVDAKKREIIELYDDDLLKIDPTGKASQLFKAIPSQLSKNASRYQASSVIGRMDDKDKMKTLLREMEDSLTVTFSHHVDDPNVGMPLHADYSQYKMFLCDTGLFITLAFWDNSAADNIIYSKLLADKLSADLGYVYENIVAQVLTAAGSRLFYHSWPTESGKHNYEIDFLLSRGNKICPLEVKSSGYKVHASLDAFRQKFSSRIQNSYLVYTKDLRKDGETLLVPVFMTMFL
ncbi:MAG: ATP-binding protein [Muribaculaceae bacterium]|nr:ATP-binding protein [Muribaculaceae bacterium]